MTDENRPLHPCAICRIPVAGEDRHCIECRSHYNHMRDQMSAEQWQQYCQLRQEGWTRPRALLAVRFAEKLRGER